MQNEDGNPLATFWPPFRRFTCFCCINLDLQIIVKAKITNS